MNSQLIIWIIVFVTSLLIILGFYLSRRVKKKKVAEQIQDFGDAGEKKVSKKLKKWGRMRHYRYINDVYLPLHDGLTQVDHLVIGPFGVLVVESKHYVGEVYGNPNDREWLQVKNEKRRKFYNPIMQNQAHVESLRQIFVKHEIYNVDISSAVVFVGRKLQLCIPPGLPVFKLKKLRKELKKSEYRVEQGIDVAKIYDVLEEETVTDKKRIKQHTKQVKKAGK